MRMLEVIGLSATFANGVLMLSKEQARERSFALEDLGDGYYEILSPVVFKRGSVVGFDGDINKALLKDIDDQGEMGENEEKKEAKPKNAKTAKAGKA